jgi:uncharacterized surface protein with fasciclin (FAS1) repeats
MREILNEEFGIFPMKTTSKITSKTIFNLIAAGSMLFAVSYPILGQSVSASSVPSAAPLKKKTLTQTPASPVVPSTPSAPTVPTAPIPPVGGGGSGDLKVPVAEPPTTPAGGGSTMPTSETPAAPKTPSSMPATAATGKTIVNIASSNKKLKTLTAAIKAAGLEETLSGEGPFTVFAPTDEAFAALPPGTLDTLLKPENKEKLAQLLTYHVVSGKVESTTLKSGDVPSVLGKPITVTVKGKKVMVNEATVTKADVPASNGVIHLIDKVILPPG